MVEVRGEGQKVIGNRSKKIVMKNYGGEEEGACNGWQWGKGNG